MIGMKMTKKILDPKVCFDLWIETGSVYKIPAILKERYGIYNDRTGNLVTPMGVWDAAWRYTLDNLVDSRQMVAQVWKANGEILLDKDWYPLVVQKAKYLYSPKKYQRFIDSHSYLTPYQ